MARILGEAARYVTEQSMKKFQKEIIIIFLSAYVPVVAISLLTLLSAKRIANILVPIVIISIPIVIKFLNKTTRKLERERMNFRKGAKGEAIIGFVLENLPDEYVVIHDLTTPFGNIDHVVVGPSGAYVIETKNWRGLVTADGNGELLLNNRSTQKNEVRTLLKAIMNVKDKIKILCDVDPYIQGILAFSSAHVEAKWGTTGNVYCVTDDGLYNYITENKKRLNKKEVDSISRAFLALARMDKDFHVAI